jgi:hypothetical protein
MKALTLDLKALTSSPNTTVEDKVAGPGGSLETIDFVILLLETAPAIYKVTARSVREHIPPVGVGEFRIPNDPMREPVRRD